MKLIPIILIITSCTTYRHEFNHPIEYRVTTKLSCPTHYILTHDVNNKYYCAYDYEYEYSPNGVISDLKPEFKSTRDSMVDLLNKRTKPLKKAKTPLKIESCESVYTKMNKCMSNGRL